MLQSKVDPSSVLLSGVCETLIHSSEVSLEQSGHQSLLSTRPCPMPKAVHFNSKEEGTRSSGCSPVVGIGALFCRSDHRSQKWLLRP